MRRLKFFPIVSIIAVLVIAPLASADHDPTHWAEVDDAGDLPDAAQVPIGEGPLASITGTLDSLLDADMYAIFITGGGGFSATTFGRPGTVDDTQLFLFDASGFGVYANDDTFDAPEGRRSTLPAFHELTPTEPGLYFLVISSFDLDPVSGGGLIFPSEPFDGVFGPTGPGGGSPISGYSGANSETGTYSIELTGAEYVPAGTPLLINYNVVRRIEETVRAQVPKATGGKK